MTDATGRPSKAGPFAFVCAQVTLRRVTRSANALMAERSVA
jgi:hypothetical protein